MVHRARCSWAVGLGKDLASKNSSQTSKQSLDVVCCHKPRNRCCPDLAQSIDCWPMPSPLQRHLHPQEDLGGRAQRFGMSDKLFEAKPSPLFQQLHQIAHSTIEKIPCNPNPVCMHMFLRQPCSLHHCQGVQQSRCFVQEQTGNEPDSTHTTCPANTTLQAIKLSQVEA